MGCVALGHLCGCGDKQQWLGWEGRGQASGEVAHQPQQINCFSGLQEPPMCATTFLPPPPALKEVLQERSVLPSLTKGLNLT